LERAGWSVGEAAFGGTWMVSGLNGKNRILAECGSQAEAWYNACTQAAAVGNLARCPQAIQQPISHSRESLRGTEAGNRGRFCVKIVATVPSGA
jgi:hypothetical protein